LGWRARDQLVDADIELLLGVVRMGADRAIDVGKRSAMASTSA
jgi:hypothetical protein